jgi:phosphatidate cytidylyltransferase
MIKRTLTALLLLPPVVYLIGWSPKWLFVLAIVAAVALALREYFALCRATGFAVFSWLGYGGSLALCLVQCLPRTVRSFFLLLLIVALFLFIATLALRRNTELKDYLGATAATVFGILYIGLTLSCLIPIRSPAMFLSRLYKHGAPPSDALATGPRALFLLFLVIWAGDICAYAIGRPLGRIPFFARISPRKTWEGALAGLAGSILAGWAFAHWFWKTADLKTVLVLAAWIAVAGQTGDLVESAIKRGAHQKDSGTLLPGHGGFLDRIDSLLFAAPALWLAVMALNLLTTMPKVDIP